jgi:UDP:flavonoid glycosyltransferase YjiC (YdhE family)
MTPAPRYFLFTAIPFVGHLNPLLRQAAELARRGFRVGVAAHEEMRGHVEGQEPGVAFVSLGSYGPMPRTAQEFQEDATREPDFVRGAAAIFTWLHELWPSHFDGLRAAVRADRPDVLVADLFAEAALDVAEAERIPAAVNDADLLSSLPWGLLPPADHLPLPLSGRPYRSTTPLQRALRALVRRLLTARSASRTGRRLNARRASRGLPGRDARARLRSRLVLVNTVFGLEYPRALPPLVHMVGPMLPEGVPPLPEEYATWLADGPPVVYVSLGTVAVASQRLLGVLVDAFASPEFRVLWALREPQQALLPTPLPANLRLESWVPSPRAILAHPNVRVFVSHCGINSVQESIDAGTPIVGIPLFGDQLDMGTRVSDAGVGLVLDKNGVSGAALRDAIRRVLTEPSFGEALPPLQSSFRLAGGVRRAADLLEALAAVGVGHYAEKRSA